MPIDLPGPALGLFELESLARGPVVADAILKQARVRIAIAEAVSPGKYLLVFSGEVGEAEESFKAGLEAAGPRLLDKLFLPHIAEGVVSALDGVFAKVGADDSVGLVELHTVSATLLAADAALKKARVQLTALHLAKGIGGKGWFSLAGVQHDVEAALDGAAAAVEPTRLVATELIQRPHAELRGRVV
ncbi:MAG: BMC domain-containing protein [Archangiaceae bacterium]|nr:BMC domain-containing protein [Archangiaceae bacterium]